VERDENEIENGKRIDDIFKDKENIFKIKIFKDK
jgi:hypothetical protein